MQLGPQKLHRCFCSAPERSAKLTGSSAGLPAQPVLAPELSQDRLRSLQWLASGCLPVHKYKYISKQPWLPLNPLSVYEHCSTFT